jgi:methionyl-tRNA formyltransferase
MKPTILFLGTPHFAVPILDSLAKNFQVVGVVTQPDRPVGRKLVLTPPPIKEKAKELGIPVFQPEKASEIPKLLPEKPDFIVTAAYGEYLPTSVLNLPKKDALNVHPSFLPNYRGATPMQSALLNGDMTTGVSIIRMVKEMDAGPIFMQEKTAMYADEKYPGLETECSKIGADLITQVIKNYDSITPVPQDNRKATHCKKILKEDGLIHWNQETAYDIYNKLRAFTPWPGVYTFYKNQKLSLLDFSVYPSSTMTNHPPGTVFEFENQILVQCELFCITLEKVQLAGKNPTDIKSFLNGHPDFLGTKL